MVGVLGLEGTVTTLVPILLVCSVSFMGYSVGLRRKVDRRLPDHRQTWTVSSSLVRVNPSAIGGSVRISVATARLCEMGSGTEGRMYRDRSDKQLPAEGFGEKRALRVMISADEALQSGEIVVSEEDARKLRLDDECLITLKFEVNRPPKIVEFQTYRGKVPIVGIPSRNITLQPVGPHKVRMPSKDGIQVQDEERRRLRLRR